LSVDSRYLCVAAVFFSETDEESETDVDAETCFPSPKMSKFVGFLSTNSSHQHEKQSFRSHQNLATESKRLYHPYIVFMLSNGHVPMYKTHGDMFTVSCHLVFEHAITAFTSLYNILGFCGGDYEECRLLGCEALWLS
jgi:hypothetical protein